MPRDTVTDAEVKAAAKKYGVRPDIFRRLVKQESGGSKNAVSPAGARGSTQLMPATAKGLGVDVNDYISVLEGGAKYLRQQLDRFGGDYEKALAAYNAGPGAVEKHGGVPPFAETQNYVRSILAGKGNARDKPGSKAAAGARRGKTVTTPGLAPMDITVGSPLSTANGRVGAAMKFLEEGDALQFGTDLRAAQAAEAAATQTVTLPGTDDVVTKTAPGRGQTAKGGPGPVEGGGWGGSEGVVGLARRHARKYNAGVTSTKRSPEKNASLGGSATSDHLTTRGHSYAEDYGITGENGYELARRAADEYGIPFTRNGISQGVKKINGKRYKIQVIYGPAVDHGDHVHVGATLLD